MGRLDFLNHTSHRPWPLPERPWMMLMRWEKLLFAHWPVSPSALSPTIPDGLELDTFEGSAWLGVVPFNMSGIRLRWLPPVPGWRAFPELNVRTYVVRDGKPGVWFYSLDTPSRLAVVGARTLFFLPYFHAVMRWSTEARECIRYRSRRAQRGAPLAEFSSVYQPERAVQHSAPGSLEHWLTERYCLYAADPRGKVWRGDVHHCPWPLQAASAKIDINTMARSLGLSLEHETSCPLLHYAESLEVAAWRIERV